VLYLEVTMKITDINQSYHTFRKKIGKMWHRGIAFEVFHSCYTLALILY